MKSITLFFTILLFLPLTTYGSADSLAMPKSNQGEECVDPKKTTPQESVSTQEDPKDQCKEARNEASADQFKVNPSLATDSDVVFLPNVSASYEDTWLHYIENKKTKKRYFFWKHRFASSISLNGEIDANSNDDLVKKYMSNGGNITINFNLGVSKFGQTHDGLSIFGFADYSYLDTKEFTSETDTQDLIVEILTYGAGFGLKFLDQFYVGWKGGPASILGNEDSSSAFYQAVDDHIMHRFVSIWALEKTNTSDPQTYIEFHRAWGAGNVDATIGIAITRSFPFKK